MALTTKKYDVLIPLPEELSTELRKLEVDEVRLGLQGKEPTEEAVARLAELKEMQESNKYTMIFEKLSRGKYRNVLKNAEPNGDDPLDSSLGYNTDVFGSLLIRASTISIFDHAGEDVTETHLDTLLDADQGMSMEKFMQIFEDLMHWQTDGSEESLNLWALFAS